MLLMLFTEKNVMLTNQMITNDMLTMSINVMTLAVDTVFFNLMGIPSIIN